MSWVIRNLILNRNEIISNIIQKDFDRLLVNLEDDDYNNLLLVEKKIKELLESDILSKTEIEILDDFSNGFTYRDLEEKYKKTRNWLRMMFIGACEKISYSLGGTFTTEGYIHEFINKYNPNEEQIQKLIEYIQSNRRV